MDGKIFMIIFVFNYNRFIIVIITLKAIVYKYIQFLIKINKNLQFLIYLI